MSFLIKELVFSVFADPYISVIPYRWLNQLISMSDATPARARAVISHIHFT